MNKIITALSLGTIAMVAMLGFSMTAQASTWIDCTASPVGEPVTITLSNLSQAYTGTPKQVGATFSPDVVVFTTFTYNGIGFNNWDNGPTEIGTYTINAVIQNCGGYTGSATAQLVIYDPNPFPNTDNSNNENQDGNDGTNPDNSTNPNQDNGGNGFADNSTNSNQDNSTPDVTAPVITAKANISTSTDSNGGKVVTFTNPTALDNVSGTIITTCTPASGTTFPVGTTVVTCTATDGAGNTATSTFDVIVALNESAPAPTPTPSSSGSSSSFSSGGSSGGGFVQNFLTAPALTCPLISTFMQVGANNNAADVLKLQGFLRDTEKLNVALTGIFDTQTENAVRAFQAKYLNDIMGPWNSAAPSGYVYITTKKKVNEIACNTLLNLTSGESAIIAQFVADQNSGSTGATTPSATGSTSPVIGGAETPGTTTPVIIGSNTDNNANTAAVVNASIVTRIWNFFKNLFN